MVCGFALYYDYVVGLCVAALTKNVGLVVRCFRPYFFIYLHEVLIFLLLALTIFCAISNASWGLDPARWLETRRSFSGNKWVTAYLVTRLCRSSSGKWVTHHGSVARDCVSHDARNEQAAAAPCGTTLCLDSALLS